MGRLFEAFAMLRQEFPELKLVKVGDPGRSKPVAKRDVEEAIQPGDN